ncbi:Spy/CpxP family protein refolding chaperone [Leptolyngbya sp. FACHB-261]|uniref:Spy/CpxP family protein refolding chaperone n=1 Tax=Leptolyngbya sp. FACHB-261 TaxID=2692806 RepID=UPI001683E5E3|nr:Spy/CpxP family protein refolding chaperone [Leptolyngbya sp. FACHB-261]MBD2104051.1 Spy/CpxP family protein refolding chaperone [Leptolyngbya sp. FACHB-261]
MSLRYASVLTALVLAFSSTIASTEPLLAQMGPQDDTAEMGSRRERSGLGWLQQLNLTPEQTQRLQAIRAQNQPGIRQRTQALRQAKQELRQLMAGTAPASQVQTKYRQVQALRQEIEQLRFDSMMAMREVLTSTQRQQLAQQLDGRRQNRRNRAASEQP